VPSLFEKLNHAPRCFDGGTVLRHGKPEVELLSRPFGPFALPGVEEPATEGDHCAAAVDARGVFAGNQIMKTVPWR